MATDTTPGLSPGTTDDLVLQAISLWGPRMVLGGVDFNDFETAGRTISSWADWIDAWSRLGDAHEHVAERFLTDGHVISAGRAYRRAAACYHFAKFVWVDDEAKNCAATEAAVAATNAALRLLDPSHKRIEAGTGAVRVAGNLRFPSGASGPFPLVVLIPGLDSTKEEFPSWESVFLERGMATLALDGPGQGEVFHLGTHIQPEYEQTIGVGLDAVETEARLDMSRVGVAGTSLGGYYATRAGAYERRVKAVVSISGPFTVDIDTARAHSQAALTFYSRATSRDEARRRLSGFDLTGVASKITRPAIFATGKLDRIVAWEQTQAIADDSAQGEFLLYDDGNHGLTNKAAEVRDLTADWMKAQLG